MSHIRLLIFVAFSVFSFLHLCDSAHAINVVEWNSRWPCITSNGNGVAWVNNPDPNYVYSVYAVKHDSVGDYLAFDAHSALNRLASDTPPYALTSTAGRNYLSDILLGDRKPPTLVNPSTGILEDGLYTAYVVSGSYLTLPDYTPPTESELKAYGWMMATYYRLNGIKSLRDLLYYNSTQATMAHLAKIFAEGIDNTGLVSAVDEAVLYDGVSGVFDSTNDSAFNALTSAARIAKVAFPSMADQIDAAKGNDNWISLVSQHGAVRDLSLSIYYAGLFATTWGNAFQAFYKNIVRGKELQIARFGVAGGHIVTAADYLDYADRTDAVVDVAIEKSSVRTGTLIEARAEVKLPSGSTPSSDATVRWVYPGGTKDLPLSQTFTHTFTSSGTQAVSAYVPSLDNAFGVGFVEVDEPMPALTFDLTYDAFSSDEKRIQFTISGLNIDHSEIDSLQLEFGDGSTPAVIGGDSGNPILAALRWTHDYPSSSLDNSYKAICTLVAKDGRITTHKRTVVIGGSGWVQPAQPPRAYKESPRETKLTLVEGDKQRFKVSVTDPSWDLDTLEWFVGGVRDDITYIPDNRISYSERNSITFNSPGEFRVLARVRDKNGAFDEVYWSAVVAASTPPKFTAVSPTYPPSSDDASGSIPVTLGAGQDVTFSVSITDNEDNLDILRWEINGETVKRDKLGSSPAVESWTTSFAELGTYRVEACVVDEFGEEARVAWVVAINGYGLPPSGEIVAPYDETPIPGTYRVGYVYDFDFNCFDADGDLSFASVAVDGYSDWNPDGSTDADDNLSGSSDRVGTSDIFFATAGEHVISLTIRDTGGNETTVSRTIKVEAADALSSVAPEIVDIFPRAGRTFYYVRGSNNDDIKLVGVAHDSDGDLDAIVMTIDGEVVETDGMHSQFSEDFSLWKTIESLNLSVGNHALSVYPVDEVGNKGAASNYTLSVVTGTPNHAPEVEAMLPTGTINVPAGTELRFAVQIFDPDGDLDDNYDGKILWTAPGYSDEDTLSSDLYQRLYERIPLNQSGTVSARINDSKGNTRTVSWNVVVGTPAAAAPQILSPSWPDGSHFHIPGRKANVDEVYLSFSLYDPDGDLDRLELYKDGVLQLTEALTSESEKYGCRFIGNSYEDLLGFNVDRDDTGIHSWQLRAIDAAGHVTTHNATYQVLRDHAAVVPSPWNVQTPEDVTLDALVPYSDEDGDLLTIAIVQQPEHGELLVVAPGKVSYDPDADYSGTDTAVLSVPDGSGGSQFVTMNITVLPVNDPPRLVNSAKFSEKGASSFRLGDELTATVYDNESSVDSLGVEVVNKSANLTESRLDDDARTWLYVPSFSTPGETAFVDVVYTDAIGAQSPTLRLLMKYVPADADSDGITDAIEAGGCTDPNDADSDDDGITDGNEDANHNGVVDAGETNPCIADSDDDGLLDGTEIGLTAPQVSADTDSGIFVADADPSTTTNPLLVDSDSDGIKDGAEDANHNGRVDNGESDPSTKDGSPNITPVLQLLLLN